MNTKQRLFSIFVDKIMAKNKLRKFAEMKAWNNVFEPTLDPETRHNFPLKGKWRSDYFNNDNPIVLELGCGKVNTPPDWPVTIPIAILLGWI